MKKKLYDLQLFAAETGASLSTDLEPAISIDFTRSEERRVGKEC